MTLADLMRALLRRWYVVLLVMGISFGLAYTATRTEPVYHARTEVVLLAPASARYPNELVTTSESLILTAGILAEQINGTEQRLKFGSALVNPVGSPGIGEDTWIQLLDTGNQWVPAFEQQVLVVDATGTTPERVSERIVSATDLIRTELAALERDQGVEGVNSIGIRSSPETPRIDEIDGSGMRAAGMTLVLGVLATIGVVTILEVRRSARAEASSRSSNGIAHELRS